MVLFVTGVWYIHDGLAGLFALRFLFETCTANTRCATPHEDYFLGHYLIDFPLFYATNLHDDSSFRSCWHSDRLLLAFVGVFSRVSKIGTYLPTCSSCIRRRYRSGGWSWIGGGVQMMDGLEWRRHLFIETSRMDVSVWIC